MLLEQRKVSLALTIATEPDREKNLAPEHRHGICGVDQPPILLQEQEDGTYLVRDGHHRRLIALHRGDTEIAAYICPPGFESPSGSPFPYFWRHGEAEVEWQGVVYDYGDMWGGNWRDGGPTYEEEMAECDCSNCASNPSEPSAPKAATSSQLKRVPGFLRQCFRLECCGPYRPESHNATPSPRTIREMQEDMGQITLGV